MLFTEEFLNQLENIPGADEWIEKLMEEEDLSFHHAVCIIAAHHKIEPEYFVIHESESAQDLRLKIMTSSLG